MQEWGPIGKQVFDRTYARTKVDGQLETFEEVVNRMVDGNLALVPSDKIAPGEREALINYISAHKIVPAGRHWWASGVPGRQFLFNCHRAGWTDQLADHVGFLFDELMKGGGVGANYSHNYMSRMHRIRREVLVSHIIDIDHSNVDEITPTYEWAEFNSEMSFFDIEIDDSREGWVLALETLCRLAQIEGPTVVLTFNYSRIRPRGSKINGFGGTASGPAPLAKALTEVAGILSNCVGRRITGLEAMEIDHAIASCVVAGNVRRSARMSMMHWADLDIFQFINLKRDGGHWTTNMSVEIDDAFWHAYDKGDEWAESVLREVAHGMHNNAEPGLYNSSLASKGERGDVRSTNPCGEMPLEEWENCNLGHVNLAKVQSMNEAEDCAALMARWLLRATFSPGMCFRQQEVVNRNRRIGVGILGFQEWLWKEHRLSYGRLSMQHIGVRESLQGLYEATKIEAEGYAVHLGIAFPIKITTVAPTGTTAKISGTSEGIHPIFARYFIRRVRYSEGHPAIDVARYNGLTIERDEVSDHTMIVEYPCRDAALNMVPEHALVQSDELTPWQMLTVQRAVQEWWADNSISYTVNFDPEKHSAGAVLAALVSHARFLKGTTFMPEGSYRQAPIERLSAAPEAATDASSAEECVGACPVR